MNEPNPVDVLMLASFVCNCDPSLERGGVTAEMAVAALARIVSVEPERLETAVESFHHG